MSFKSITISIVSTFVFCGVLCSTFVNYGANDCYFLLFPLMVSIGVTSLLAFILSILKGNNFRFKLPDVLITAGVFYYLMRYDYQLHLADWKVIYAAILLLLWYVVRIIFSSLQVSKNIVSVGIVGIGCMLAGWGLLQLYSFCHSNHLLFCITGPFFNPGPYSGYLAMLLPLCLHSLLSAQGWRRYCWLGALALMLCIVPATMSRSAWLAIGISLLWIWGMHKGWLMACRSYARQFPRKAASFILTVCMLMALIFILLFQLKADSARGRLLIWKNTCTAVMEKPLMGYGPGSFQMVYGKAQAAYFAAGNGTMEEKRVAGYAEYAFNEYLSLALTEGIAVCVVVVVVIGMCLRMGMKRGRYGICGAILSLLIFSFSSYPMHFPAFVVAGVCLLLACGIGDVIGKPFILCVCLTLWAGGYMEKWQQEKDACGKWMYARMLYHSGGYKAANEAYEKLYPVLRGRGAFLFEYGHSLHKSFLYGDSNKYLEEACRYSSDPMVLNVMGKNYQEQHCYEQAEKFFYRAIHRLPGRIYPYYLLANLYAEPDFYKPDKLKEAADSVLTKEPKVHSTAIDEMRSEVREILKRKDKCEIKK
jgi:tetratricopeptide (TPR) repeat protein